MSLGILVLSLTNMTDLFPKKLIGLRQSIKRDLSSLPQDAHFLLAISGGIDSMMLLDVFRRILPATSFTVVHVDHQLRAESKVDWELISGYCSEYGIPRALEKVDIDTYTNIQQVARIKRYEALHRHTHTYTHTYIVTAHNKNDQAETVLMKMMRGTGLRGAGGIKRLDRNLYRPLLDVSREQISEYVRDNGVLYVEDASNASDKYLRNNIRLNMLPVMEDCRPGSMAGIVRTSKALQQDSNFIDSHAQKVYNRIATHMNRFGEIDFDGPEWSEQHPAIQYRLLQLAVAKTGLENVAARAFEQVLSGAKETSIGGGWKFIIKRNNLALRK